jgi:hypothetical protein
MIQVPNDLPPSIRDACEPCRALPRSPGRTWDNEAGPSASWSIVRTRRAVQAAKWPKAVAGTERAGHVAPLLARLDSEASPTALLEPRIEATWLWLENEKSSKLTDAGERIIDVWAAIDPARAIECYAAYVAAKDREGAQLEGARRLRAHLSVADEASWSRARDVATRLGERAPRELAAMLAYLFPEEEARAKAIGAKAKKKAVGFEHLLALALTDADALAEIVKKGDNVWGLLRLQGVVPAWATVALGKAALPVLEILGARWPDNVAAELAYLRAAG